MGMQAVDKHTIFATWQYAGKLAAIGIMSLSVFLTACAASDGTTFSATGSSTTSPSPTPSPSPSPTPAPAPNPPTSVPVPEDLLFFDDFEYTVGRNDVAAASLFQQYGRWNGAKTEQSNQPGANGYLYTAASIPGYSGALPGGASTRVLVMEARPASQLFQTDFYLQYGNGESSAYNNAVPGNVWFQFWIYINHSGTQLSFFDEGKFIYACNTSYPCHSHKWMLSLGTQSTEPLWMSLGTPSTGSVFLNNGVNTTYDNISVVTNTNAEPGNEWKLGQYNTGERITSNRWTLVKIHLDTSTQSGRYEAWMRPFGGSWTKVVEWIDGVTPGFTWRVNASHVGGHRTFRMPSTIGRANGTSYDAWIYMDDFAMARSEGGLPTYSN